MTDPTEPPSDDSAEESKTPGKKDTEGIDPSGSADGDSSTRADRTADSPSEPSESEDNSLGKKVLTVGIATGLGFGALVVSLGILLPLLFLSQWLGLAVPEAPLALISLELFVGQVIGMGGLSALYLWKTGRGLEYVPIRRPTLIETAIIIVAPFGIIFVTAMISQLSLLLGVEPSEHALGGLGEVDPTLYLYLIPLMFLIVGPFEELLYRGVVQRRLGESFGPVTAIMLASVIFALIHIPAHGFSGAGVASVAASMVALFCGSLIFGGIYEYTENLTVVALIHGLYNSILLVLLYVVTVYGPELEEFAEQPDQALVLLGM